jgi:transglycosylase-like protein with SLT domain
MTAADFVAAKANKSTNPNTPGSWQVKLTHIPVGGAQLRAGGRRSYAGILPCLSCESHFRTDAIGATTRSGDHARGIAQFTPATASERNLLDPTNPVEAIPKAAEFLKELRQQFGNCELPAETRV